MKDKIKLEIDPVTLAIYERNTKRIIADCYPASPDPDRVIEFSEAEQFAKLFQAAPEMLAILKEIQAIPANQPGRIVCLVQKINAVVSKVEES